MLDAAGDGQVLVHHPAADRVRHRPRAFGQQGRPLLQLLTDRAEGAGRAVPDRLLLIALGALAVIFVLIRLISIPDVYFATTGRGIGLYLSLLAALGPDFKYEPGMIVAEGEYVMIHGRYTGWGPKPMVAVDIFRVVGGKLVEHWDVMQEEVPVSSTASGNPMFSPA